MGQISNPTIIPAGLVPPDPLIINNSSSNIQLNGGGNLCQSVAGSVTVLRTSANMTLNQTNGQITFNVAGWYVAMLMLAVGGSGAPAAGGLGNFQVTPTQASQWPGGFNCTIDTGSSGFGIFVSQLQATVGSAITPSCNTNFNWSIHLENVMIYRLA